MKSASSRFTNMHAAAAAGIIPCKKPKPLYGTRTTTDLTQTAQRSVPSLRRWGMIGASSAMSATIAVTCPPLASTPKSKPVEPYTLRPVKVFPPTESLLPPESSVPPSSPHLTRPDIEAFKAALLNAEVTEEWWYWARNKRHQWIFKKRTQVWSEMHAKGFSFGTIGAVSGGFDHGTISRSLRPKVKPAVPTVSAESEHREATATLGQPAPELADA